MPDPTVLFTGPVDSPRRYAVTMEAVADAVAGGEGLVYLARDTHRDTAVALKLLTVIAVADYGRLVERSTPFAEIEHPNLMSHVEVFIGTALTDDPSPDIADFDVIYTVAEWIDGDRLPDVVDTVDTDQLLGYVAGIARGLHALHHHRSPDAPLGIVHRDVKPSNVRVTPDGRAVLIDFGVARPLDDGDLTQGIGTYRWRAPEVLSGSSSITTAVDVWGLGALAYWALVGQPPGLDGAGAAREQLTHTSRCRQVADPIGVAGHIATLLESDPTKRPSDLTRWARQLDSMLTTRRPSPWKRSVAAAALMAIPGVVLLMNTSEGDPGAVATDTTTVSASATTDPDVSATTLPTGLLSAILDDRRRCGTRRIHHTDGRVRPGHHRPFRAPTLGCHRTRRIDGTGAAGRGAPVGFSRSGR
jgi:serine/threonine protein kinase